MEFYVAQPKDYWISPNAVNITLNALGEANRIQGSVASGAVVLCHIDTVKPESDGSAYIGNGDGLQVGVDHNPRRWPLSLSPTYFNSDTAKYVYVAIPRSITVGTQAMVVFPSELLDIYGRANRPASSSSSLSSSSSESDIQQETEESSSSSSSSDGGEIEYAQVGSTDYFYIFLQGIISEVYTDGGVTKRRWEEYNQYGELDTWEGNKNLAVEAEWYTYFNNLVTFLKEITMSDDSWFSKLNIGRGTLGGLLKGIATRENANNVPVNSSDLAVTPSYLDEFGNTRYLSKIHDDTAQGIITFLQGLKVGNGAYGIDGNGMGHLLSLVFDEFIRSKGADPSFENGHGIWLDALTGTGSFDGLEVRGFMRVMELIINRLQLMESDYSFTEGGTIDHVDYEKDGNGDYTGRLILHMRQNHEKDYTPFYPGDVIYAKINNLLSREQPVPDGHTVTKNGSYYTSWMWVDYVDYATNSLIVRLYDSTDLADETIILVPGGLNFTLYGTRIPHQTDADVVIKETEVNILFSDAVNNNVVIVKNEEAEEGYSSSGSSSGSSSSGSSSSGDFSSVVQDESLNHTLGETGFDTEIVITRHGNKADGYYNDKSPEEQSPAELAQTLRSQKERQQSWHLSTTDQRLIYYWRVDAPIVTDQHIALCLGMLPRSLEGIIPSYYDWDKPSLYISQIFYETAHQIRYPSKIVKVDRGQWTNNPTEVFDYLGFKNAEWIPDGQTVAVEVNGEQVVYGELAARYGAIGNELDFSTGDTIVEPYHCATMSRATWLNRRLSTPQTQTNDGELEMRCLTEFMVDLETSRVFHKGILWECISDVTTEEPGFGCHDWIEINGDLMFRMYLTDKSGSRIDNSLTVIRGRVNETLTPMLTRGQEDLASMSGVVWSWDIIEADGNIISGTANTRQLTVTDAILPESWLHTGLVILRCKATFGANTLTASVRLIHPDISSYNVEFSNYVDVITVDDVGNCIGGLYTTSEGGSAYRSYRIQSAITVRRSGLPLLYLPPATEQEASASSSSSDTAPDASAQSSSSSDDSLTPIGFYKIFAEPHGCNFIIEDSTLYITHIDNIKDGVAGTSDDVDFDYDTMRLMDSCSVDLLIDCEGVGVIQKNFPITIKHSSEPFVSADLTNQSSSISWNTRSASYIGLPIAFDVQMWHNNEFLNVSNVALTTIGSEIISSSSSEDNGSSSDGGSSSSDNAIGTEYIQVVRNDFIGTLGTPDPTKIQCTIQPSYVTKNNKTHTEARVTITYVPKDLPMIVPISVGCSADYAGVPYERTLTHTINKTTDTNVYFVLPSVPSIITGYDNNGHRVTNESTVSCKVTCDSTDDKHYDIELTNGVNIAHRIVLTYQLLPFISSSSSDGGSSASGEEVLYTAPIPVSPSVRAIRFTAYTVDNPTLTGLDALLASSNNPHIEDSEDVPNIFDGKEGAGIGFAGTEDYYAVSADKDTLPTPCPASQSQVTIYENEEAFVTALGNSGTWAKSGISTNRTYPWLWNFEKHTMSDGTVQVSPAHRIGNFAKGIRSITEFYALSANDTEAEALASIYNPCSWEVDYRDELYECLWGGYANAFKPQQWWFGTTMVAVTEEESLDEDDELVYDGIETLTDAQQYTAALSKSVPTYYRAGAVVNRAPTASLPYQWNWEHIVYNDGSSEDFYHISARIGEPGQAGPKGDSPIACYRWYKDGLTPLKPTAVNSDEPAALDHINDTTKAYPASLWSKNAVDRPAEGWKLWMCQSVKHTSAAGVVTRDAWGDPVFISGANGSPGQDGNDREWIFKYDANGYNGDNGQLADDISDGSAASGSETNKNQRKWIPNGWYDNALTLSENHVTVYASYRDYNGATKTWGDFQTPIVWSHWGETGVDGAGVEYVFVRTKVKVAPVVVPYYDAVTHPDGQYMDNMARIPEEEEYLPVVQVSSGNISGTGARYDQNWGNDCDECTDNPVGPSHEWPYEWVLSRKCRLNVDRKSRSWELYTGTMSPWSNWAEDGVSPTFTYTEEAWSPDDTMADASVGPRTASYIADSSLGLPVAADWSTSTPSNTNNYAFLWRRSRIKVFNSVSRTYDFENNSSWSYIRLNGTNGTSIKPQGSVIAIVAANGSAPSSGMTSGDLYIEQGDPKPFNYDGSAWDNTGMTAAADGDCYVVERSCQYDVDGDNVKEDVEGFMFMWSNEANNGNGAWISLGPFKGDPGTTYYTHIAWAREVTIGTPNPPVTVPSGQKSTPNAASVTDFSIAFVDGYGWMGILINTEGGQDPAGNDKLLYTWARTKGDTGSSPWVADLDNEMDGIACDADGHPVQQQTVTTNVRLWYGSEAKAFYTKIYEGSTSTEVSDSSSSNIYVSHSRTDAQHTGISDAITLTFGTTATLALRQQYRIELTSAENSSIKRTLWLTVNGIMGGAVYNLLPSESVISTQRIQGGYSPDKFSISCGYTKSNGGSDPIAVADASATASALIDGKYYIYFRLRARDGSVWESVWTRYNSTTKGNKLTNASIATYDKVEFVIYKHSNGDTETLSSLTGANIIDRETIPVIEGGQDGAGSVKVDLDNESEILLYDTATTPASNAKPQTTSQATLYDGTTAVGSNLVTWSVSGSSGVAVQNSGNATAANASYSGAYDCWITVGGLLKVNGINATDAYVTVRGEYPINSGTYYYAKITLHKQIGGEKYDLRNINPNHISYDGATGQPATTNVSVTVMRTPASTGIAVPASSLPTGYSLLFCVKNTATGSHGYVKAVGYNNEDGDKGNTGSATFTNINSGKTELRVVIGKLLQSSQTIDDVQYVAGEVDESSVLDSETIPVVVAPQGPKGDDVKVVFNPSEIEFDADEHDNVTNGTYMAFTVQLTVNGTPVAISKISNITGKTIVEKSYNQGIIEGDLTPSNAESVFSSENKLATLIARYISTPGWSGSTDSISMIVTDGTHTAIGVLTVSKNRKGNTGPEGAKAATVVMTPSIAIFNGDTNSNVPASTRFPASGYIKAELVLPNGSPCALTGTGAGAILVGNTASVVQVKRTNGNTVTTDNDNNNLSPNSNDVEFYLLTGNTSGKAEGIVTIRLTGTSDGKTYSQTGALSIKTVQKGDTGPALTDYSLVCTPSSVTFRRTPVGELIGQYIISCAVKKKTGNSAAQNVSPASGYVYDSNYYLFYRKTGSSQGSWTPGNSYTINYDDANEGVTAIEFALAADSSATNIVKEVSVPVVCEGASKMFYPMGEFDPTYHYQLDDFKVPLVFVPSSTYNSAYGVYGNYWYLKQTIANGVTLPDTNYQPKSPSDYWAMASEYGVVITQGLFAQYAKLGSAIICGDYMFSQNGYIGNTPYNNGANYGSGNDAKPAYTYFDENFPSGSGEVSYAVFTVDLDANQSKKIEQGFYLKSGVHYEIELQAQATTGWFMIAIGQTTYTYIGTSSSGTQTIDISDKITADGVYYLWAYTNSSSGAAKGTIKIHSVYLEESASLKIGQGFYLRKGVHYEIELQAQATTGWFMIAIGQTSTSYRNIGSTGSGTQKIDISANITADGVYYLWAYTNSSSGAANGTVKDIKIIADGLFAPNWWVNLLTGKMSAAKGNFVVDANGDVSVNGRVQTKGATGHIDMHDGIVDFYGTLLFPNIILGVDNNGCAILKFYDKDGNFKYDLGPDSIIQSLNNVDGSFFPLVKLGKFDDYNNSYSLGRVRSMAVKSVTLYYRFDEGYTYLNSVKSYDFDGDYDKKVYNGNATTTQDNHVRPSDSGISQIASGYYVGEQIQVNGNIFKRAVYSVSNQGGIPSLEGNYYYYRGNTINDIYLTNASGNRLNCQTSENMSAYIQDRPLSSIDG